MIIAVFFSILALFIGIACCAPGRKPRILFGCVSLGWSGLMFVAANMTETFDLNIWYSQAAHDLLSSSVEAIDAGDAKQVSAELAAMRDELDVTYERRGNFRELATATAERINSRDKGGAKLKKQADIAKEKAESEGFNTRLIRPQGTEEVNDNEPGSQIR